MRNLLLTLRFVGDAYCGWQVQKNGISVMEKMQDAIERVTGIRSPVKGCSRTDSGVHANAYCLNFKTESAIPTNKMGLALNTHLPWDIAVTGCQEMPLSFHARYDCLGKEYLYHMHLGSVRDPFLADRAMEVPGPPLLLDEMDRAAAHFVGKHDFRSFCSIKTDQEDTVRTITHCFFKRQGADHLILTVAGDGFLFHMVRILAGTLLWVGKGRLLPEQIPAILEARDRGLAGATAPACGLYLNRVFY